MMRRMLTPIVLCTCLAPLLLACRAQEDPPPPLNRVAAWLPSSWDSARARGSWESNRVHIQELSPVWYQLDASGDGSINAYAGARDTALVNEAHTQSTLVIPLINNHYADTGFADTPVSTMIHDPAHRAAHVTTLERDLRRHVCTQYPALQHRPGLGVCGSLVEAGYNDGDLRASGV